MHETRLVIGVGRLVKNPIVRALRDALFSEHFDFTIDEQMGWVDGALYVTIRDADKVRLDSIERRIFAMVNDGE